MSDVKVTIDLTGTETPRSRTGRTREQIAAEAAENKAKRDAATAERKAKREAESAANKAKKAQEKLDRDAANEAAKAIRDEENARKRYARSLEQAQNQELSARDAALGRMASAFGFGEVFSFVKSMDRVQATTKKVEQLAALGKDVPVSRMNEKGVKLDALQNAIKYVPSGGGAGSGLGGGGGAGGGPGGLPGASGGGKPKGGFFGTQTFANISLGIMAFEALMNISTKLYQAFVSLDKAVEGHINNLAKYDGYLSALTATREITRIRNEMEQAREIRGPASQYLQVATRQDTAFLELQTEAVKALTPAVVAIKEEVIVHLKMITSIFEVLDKSGASDIVTYLKYVADWIDNRNPASTKFWFNLYENIKNGVAAGNAEDPQGDLGTETERELAAFFGLDMARVADPRRREFLPELRGVEGD